MTMLVDLTQEDCFCDLQIFYEKVARKTGKEISDDMQFDCRKICISKSVQDVLWSYYRDEKKLSNGEIAALFLILGPKATLEDMKQYPYRAEVEEGFLVDEGSHVG